MTGPDGSSCLAPAPARTRPRRSACGVPVRQPSRARDRHRRSQGPWAAPVGPGTGGAGMQCLQGERAARLRERSYLCARPRQRGAADQPPAAMAARPAGRGQSAVRRSAARQPWRRGATRRQRPQGPAPSPLDEGIGLPHAHHRPPGEPQPRPGQVRQVHPRSLLRRAGPPEALPAAALLGLQHRAGPGPTADRRVAGQPDQLQQPPQRSGDVQLASRSVSHLRGSSCHSNACSPCWVMACSPPVPRQRTQRRLGVAGHALVLGAQQLWRRCHHYGLGSLVDPHSLGRQGIDPQPRHHDGAARVAGWGAHWVSSRHRRRRAPSPCASRSEGQEEQQ
jgi:hypothetical protein